MDRKQAGPGDPPAIRDKLAVAVRFHQSGEWAAAERLYREILEFDPGHADSLNLLGVMALQFRHFEAAASLIGQAIGRNPQEPSYHYNLGSALKAQGQAEAAAASFEQALVLRPDYAEALNNLGNLHREAGRLAEAAAHYEKALAIRPDMAELHNNLGGIHEQAGRLDEATACFRRALGAKTDFVAAHYNLGKVLQAQGALDEAAASYRQALSIQADHAEAAIGMGAVLAARGRPQEAAGWYRGVIEHRPDHAAAHYNLALALEAEGRAEEAIAAYSQAIRIVPDYVEALTNLGVALHAEGRFAEAVGCYERALAARPDAAEIHNDLGAALQSLGRPATAMASYRRALKLRPAYAGAQMNMATCQLLMGDLKAGFAGFRARWAVPDSPIRLPELPRPLWEGESLEGRSILVHCEQGLGDSLHFIRYAPLLAEQAGRVLVLVPPGLARLFGRIPEIEVVTTPPDPAAYDYHCPLLCLPRLLGTELATIPAAIPYLSAEPAAVEAWAERLKGLGGGCRIGLVWAGAPRADDRRAFAVDRRRSLALAALAPLGGLAETCFISLQKGPPAAQAKTPPAGLALFDPTANLGDFADTAALIANLDLVISVDTSVAHLAGALGRPVWLLSRFDGCWRWLLDRADSPWYPTLRLFRQPTPGDWDSVVMAVRAALLDRLRGTGESDPRNPLLAAGHPPVL